jgi:hypothetical protein
VLAQRAQLAQQYRYDYNARKLDFEKHLRALVLLHITAYSSGRDLVWAAKNDLLFRALGADFDLSVPGLSGAMKDRPIEPYWHLLTDVMRAVGDLPHQRLRGVEPETWQRITDLFSQVDLFDATQLALPPSVAEWAQSAWDLDPELDPDAENLDAQTAADASKKKATSGAKSGTKNGSKSGFKLQLKLSGAAPGGQRHFKKALLTKRTGNDSPYFGDLLDLEEGAGALYLFDCGYFDTERYAEITRSGNFFVTKLHSNFTPTSAESCPVSESARQGESEYRVLSDDYVYLGQEWDPEVGW